MLDTVMRFGLHASPQGAVSTSTALSTSFTLSIGSPIPMNTIFVSLSDSGIDSIWLSMPAELRSP